MVSLILAAAIVITTAVSTEGQADANQAPQVVDDRIGFVLTNSLDPYTLGTSVTYQSLNATVVPGVSGIGGEQTASQPAAVPRSYVIKKGDTLSSIAAEYGFSSYDLLAVNTDLNANLISPGQAIIIPDTPASDEVKAALKAEQAKKVRAAIASSATPGSTTSKKTTASIALVNPLSRGSYTISRRIIPGVHKGIDMAAPYGTRVSSAWDGCVAYASGGWNGGYGNMVLIESANGISAIYAHLSSISVSAGECVQAGEEIGKVGSTGNSTGSHLHFEPKRNGVAFDPGTI